MLGPDGDNGPDNGIVTLTDRAGITIKGPGVITGFSQGITVGGARLKVLGVTGPCPGSLIASNIISEVGTAMDLGGGSSKLTVRDNVINGASGFGIVVADAVGDSRAAMLADRHDGRVVEADLDMRMPG